MDGLFNFGDVFRYSEKEYVYFGGTETVVYAAWILNTDHSHQLNELYKSKSLRGGSTALRCESQPQYCFVILQTVPFTGRAAYFGNSGKDQLPAPFEKIGCLDKTDIDYLKREILDSNGVGEQLKIIIRNSA
jgi:hypothetical protein